MPYVVDGSNVMAHNVGWHRDKPAARRRLIRDAARFVASTRAKVTLVFDGAPDDDFPDGTTHRSVKILYSRPGEDADTRIVELVRTARSKRQLVVVTSDRELASRARGEGAQVIRSGEFRTMLTDAAGGEPEKPDADDVDQWLAVFGTREQ
jgi:predicted RNA-binding protein with PIN domain